MKRSASAVWTGGLKDGKGTISTESGVLADTQYSFGTRFENGKGTNPEELIGAAHAGCFSMALSAQLGEAGMTAERIATTASVTLEQGRRRLRHHGDSPDRQGEDSRGRRRQRSRRRPTTPRPGARSRRC